MSAPTTKIETVKTTKETMETTGANGKTVVAQTTTNVTHIEVSKVQSDGSEGVSVTAVIDESEDFYEEIDEEEDEEEEIDTEVFAEEAPDDGRGKNDPKIGGVVRDAKGKPVKVIPKRNPVYD